MWNQKATLSENGTPETNALVSFGLQGDNKFKGESQDRSLPEGWTMIKVGYMLPKIAFITI